MRARAAWAVVLLIVLIFEARAAAVVFTPNAEDAGFGSFLVGAQRVGINYGLGKDSSANSSDKREYAYSSSYDPQPERRPSPISRFIGSIRSLPLGAKIGITVVFTGTAWICELIWFLRLLNQPKRWWRDSYLLLSGLFLLLSPGILWW